jgi:hypothetical protein
VVIFVSHYVTCYKYTSRTPFRQTQGLYCRKSACPPEDCGGPPGYEHLLEALRDPKHEEHEEMREWIGGEFDPDAFDLDEVDAALKHIR